MDGQESTNNYIDERTKRIETVLNLTDKSFEEARTVPEKDKLTYENGFYVTITALFIDMIGSSNLAAMDEPLVLANIYRSYISECIAVMKSSNNYRDINIQGDCVWGIFNAISNDAIDDVYDVATRLTGSIVILNDKYRKKRYPKITVGIGMDKGRALMIKAGYEADNRSEIIWVGNVVNNASHLSKMAGRKGKHEIIVTPAVFYKLSEDRKEQLVETTIDNFSVSCYGRTVFLQPRNVGSCQIKM